MSNNTYSVKIGGQAGQGIKSTGYSLAKSATRSGYNIYNYIEYPSLIKGGHNVMQITFSESDCFSQKQKIDFLIALDQATIDLHAEELEAVSGVIYDPDYSDVSKIQGKTLLFPVPLKKITQEIGGTSVVSNNVALGALASIFGGDVEIFKKVIEEQFSEIEPSTIEVNKKAIESGFSYASTNYPDKFEKILLPKNQQQSKIIINGTEAVALGAISAGVQFASIYPMSPVSNILHLLAKYHKQFDIVLKQVEDEISAIHMAIGASFAGARAMTSTSGGGFCLMSEGYGLAGMTETPLVIIEGMRGAPATGLPTWSEQGDLRFVLHAHQGEFPRIILAPGDSQEAFYLTQKAFNLAEKYQTPVVILLDKNLCDNEQSFSPFDSSSYEIDRGKIIYETTPDYNRFAPSPDGISPRTVLGSGNHFLANSDEHNSHGYSSESIADRNEQHSKRLKKLETCSREDMQSPILHGPSEAEITIVSWGSNKASILEAQKSLPNTNFLQIQWINPFPAEAVKSILEKAKKVIDIECNSTAQMAGLIKEKTGYEIQEYLLKNDGRPLFPEEIISKITSMTNAK